MLMTEPSPTSTPAPTELDTQLISNTRNIEFAIGCVCGRAEVKVESQNVEDKNK